MAGQNADEFGAAYLVPPAPRLGSSMPPDDGNVSMAGLLSRRRWFRDYFTTPLQQAAGSPEITMKHEAEIASDERGEGRIIAPDRSDFVISPSQGARVSE
jgi:hypothetical protein